MRKLIKHISCIVISALVVTAVPALSAKADTKQDMLLTATATKIVTITPQCAKSAAAALTKLSLKIGDSGYDLKYFGVSDYKTQLQNGTLKWVSSDSTVAKVDQKGVVTPISEGTAEISLHVGTGEYQCTPVVVTVTDPKKADVTPTATPTPVPTATPVPTEGPASGELEPGTVLYENNTSAYKRSVIVTAPLIAYGEWPVSEQDWKDFIRTIFTIKLYDPITDTKYVIDQDHDFPAEWSVAIVRMTPSSSYIEKIEIVIPAGECYSYIELPINVNISFADYWW